MNNKACIKRLQKELAQCTTTQQDESIRLSADPENIRHWNAVIIGPEKSFYEGFTFELIIDVPMEYPLVPPRIKFGTKIFHPNVKFDDGEICLDILKKEWSPAWNLQSACRAIVAILDEPAHDSPLNCDAGNILRVKDYRAYKSIVDMYCAEYCTRDKEEERDYT